MDGTYFGVVHGSISGNVAECLAAFDSLAGELGSVRAALVDIGGQLTALIAFLSSQDSEDDLAQHILSTARDLSEALAGWCDPQQADGMLPGLAAGLRHLDQIEREARILLSVASLTRVVSADGRLSDLEDYVQSLRDMAGKIADECVATRNGLRQTQQEYHKSGHAILAAREAIEDVAERIDSGDTMTRALAANLAEETARLRQTAEGFPVAAARGTAGLIGCIQFSDILSQRLDHVQQILALSHEAVEGGAALVDIVAAQIAACGRDAAETLDQAARALSDLRGDGQSALDVFTGKGGHGAAEALNERRRAALSRVEKVSDAARSASQLASELADGMARHLADGMRSTESLDRATYEINLSALNATLLSARQSQSREALKVLSGAVRESASVCAENSGACRAAIQSCATQVKDGRIERIRDRTLAFQQALDEARAGHDRANQTAMHFAEMRMAAQGALQRLIAATKAGQAALEKVRTAIEAICETGRGLPVSDEMPLSVPSDLLARVQALYTMERERDVHRVAIGLDLE